MYIEIIFRRDKTSRVHVCVCTIIIVRYRYNQLAYDSLVSDCRYINEHINSRMRGEECERKQFSQRLTIFTTFDENLELE